MDSNPTITDISADEETTKPTDQANQASPEQQAGQESTEELAAAPAEVEEGKKSKNPLDKIIVSMPVTCANREDLDEIVANHQIWYESVLNPMKKIIGGRANLKGADLSGWDLSGLNLSGATLENVNFIGANLSKANLTAANLKNADLQGATLKGTKLKRAILSHADFRDADMEDADLRDACTDFARFDRKGAQAADTSDEQEKEKTMIDGHDTETPIDEVSAVEEAPIVLAESSAETESESSH